MLDLILTLAAITALGVIGAGASIGLVLLALDRVLRRFTRR